MTSVVEFLIGILGRVCSGLISTYVVRLLDKIKTQKSNRLDQE